MESLVWWAILRWDDEDTTSLHLINIFGMKIHNAFEFQVLEYLPCGAGLFSEEGAECLNKIFRFNREHHARQSSVELNLLDVFTR